MSPFPLLLKYIKKTVPTKPIRIPPIALVDILCLKTNVATITENIGTNEFNIPVNELDRVCCAWVNSRAGPKLPRIPTRIRKIVCLLKAVLMCLKNTKSSTNPEINILNPPTSLAVSKG